MDIAHKDHLLAVFHGLLRGVVLLFCVLTELLVLVLWHSVSLYLAPVSAMLLLYCYHHHHRSIALVDFSCLKPCRRLRFSMAGFHEHLQLAGCFDSGSIEFMANASQSSGMGDETYLPPAAHCIPPASTHSHAIEEAHMLFFPALDDLFARTRVPPSAVGALVVNCCAFCPAPSLSSIIVNRYGMRADVMSFNLSGMGCSAGCVGVDLAAGVLRAHAVSYAVVVSAEILTVGWYGGKDRSKLFLNSHFRTGCSAALVTNDVAAPRVRYRLANKTRTNTTADDRSYRAEIREEDAEGITGFTISRGVGRMASELLRTHLVTLGLSILPWRQKVRYAAALLVRMQPPIPDFRAAADHFCLPTAGKPMILRLGMGLGLGEREMEAALMTNHRFGNQSASLFWYQLAYLEAKGRVRKGDTVWQLGMGTGLRVTSLVWERVAVADIRNAVGPWMECIDQYPVWET